MDEVRNGKASITGDDAKHLTRVLRVEPGERYEISDNTNVYLAEISLAHKGEVVFDIVEKVPLKPAGLRIALYVALFKFDHFEWLVEKATELGVDRIAPVIAVRSERGLDQAAIKRVERWRRIVLEASQQARRDRLPDVDLPVKLGRALAACETSPRILLDEDSTSTVPLLEAVAGREADEVAIALGPEGGWTDEERAAFVEKGWVRASLGVQILRAETAGIAGLAVLQAAWAAR